MKLNESSKLERSKSFKVRTMLADLCCISKQSELLRVNRDGGTPAGEEVISARDGRVDLARSGERDGGVVEGSRCCWRMTFYPEERAGRSGRG